MRISNTALFKPLGSNKKSLRFSNNEYSLLKILRTVSNSNCLELFLNVIVKEFGKVVFNKRVLQNTYIN